MATPKITSEPGTPEFIFEALSLMTEEGQLQSDTEDEVQQILRLVIIGGDQDALSKAVDLMTVGIHYVKGYLT
jgi:hypothetical protein